jgi:Fe-S cluster assembly protein SufD
MAIVDKKNPWYLQHFELLEKSLNGESKLPIHEVRKNALAQFVRLGFPTIHNEEWRFTNIAPIRNAVFELASKTAKQSITKAQVEKMFLTGSKSPKLVFINGYFAQDLSSSPTMTGSLQVGSLSVALKNNNPVVGRFLAHHADTESNAFTALSTAFIQDGAFIHVGDNLMLDQPIECLFLTSTGGQMTVAHPRNLFIVGKNSKAMIVESYFGFDENPYLNNLVTEIVVGENSIVEHDKLGMEGSKAYHIGTICVRQATGSNYTNNSVSLGGSLVRNNVMAVLAAERCEATLNGLSLGTRDQLIDNHTTIDHTMPNCVSHELYKSILDGRARGVFNGKIFVRKDAQKTDAKQTNKTLLLSDDATMNTKPQLEIFADDVKCTHGATIGQLDEEQVFYLRSRGISERASRDILTYAFASDVIDKVHSDTLRERLHELIQNRLEASRLHKGSM